MTRTPRPRSEVSRHGAVARCVAALGQRASWSRIIADHRDGFALIELIVVAGLIAVITGIAIPVSRGMIARAKAASTTLEVLTWLEEPRVRATAERRNFEVTFDTATNRIKVERVNADASRTLILNRELPGDMKFLKFAGTLDTPDLFGNASAIDFDGPAPHMFASDGSFTDANGDPSNGTIQVGKTNQPETGRAITVFGVTGLLRSWKLAGTQWN